MDSLTLLPTSHYLLLNTHHYPNICANTADSFIRSSCASNFIPEMISADFGPSSRKGRNRKKTFFSRPLQANTDFCHYHKLFVGMVAIDQTSTRCRSNLRSTAIMIVKLSREDPPLERNGRGMPITGITPMVIPILTNMWMKMMPAIP